MGRASPPPRPARCGCEAGGGTEAREDLCAAAASQGVHGCFTRRGGRPECPTQTPNVEGLHDDGTVRWKLDPYIAAWQLWTVTCARRPRPSRQGMRSCTCASSLRTSQRRRVVSSRLISTGSSRSLDTRRAARSLWSGDAGWHAVRADGLRNGIVARIRPRIAGGASQCLLVSSEPLIQVRALPLAERSVSASVGAQLVVNRWDAR